MSNQPLVGAGSQLGARFNLGGLNCIPLFPCNGGQAGAEVSVLPGTALLGLQSSGQLEIGPGQAAEESLAGPLL